MLTYRDLIFSGIPLTKSVPVFSESLREKSLELLDGKQQISGKKALHLAKYMASVYHVRFNRNREEFVKKKSNWLGQIFSDDDLELIKPKTSKSPVRKPFADLSKRQKQRRSKEFCENNKEILEWLVLHDKQLKMLALNAQAKR